MNTSREYKYLRRIADVVSAYSEGRINISVGNDDFDIKTHTYDISVIMGLIHSLSYEGRGLIVPNVNKIQKKGEKAYEVFNTIC